MRALVLISSLATGGAERVAVCLLRHLARQVERVPICTVTRRHDGPFAGELTRAGVPRHDLGARRLADPQALRRLARLLREKRIDVLHAHGQDASILAAAARHVCRFRLVVTRHVLEEPANDWRQSIRARGALLAFRHADAAVAVSSAAADRLAELAGMPRSSVRVLLNGIDLEQIVAPPQAAARAQLAAQYPISTSDRLVLVPAVLRLGKGHDLLLSALPLLRLLVPGVRLLFAGSGEEESRLRERAAAFGGAVLFLGERSDVPSLLSASELAVLPSRSEALPTALIEAAAAGRPVVATSVGGTPEVVLEGRTGLLVPPDDATALAHAIAQLLLDRELARAMGDAAERHAREHFGIERHANATWALWQQLASERHA